jgi:NAD dependent epimerase/dehydratase family enzyme
MGEPGQELLLADQNVEPKRLLTDGFEFTHTTVTSAMEAVFGTTKTAA